MSLASLGWTDFFGDQLGPHEANLVPTRIATVHRDRLTGISQTGRMDLTLPMQTNTGDYAVGDWVLVDPHSHLLHRRLIRKTVLERRTQGTKVRQLAAANVDTLFIVTSCNADFNPARLERYLALANEAGTTPVILLTKADSVADAREYKDQSAALQRGLIVVTLNPRTADAATALAPWCGAGQTVALVGSSGVGKSTLVNTLAGSAQQLPQQTGDIREQDAKGRHTTTSRSLHPIAGGGWVIDTPGMRTLQVSDVAYPKLPNLPRFAGSATALTLMNRAVRYKQLWPPVRWILSVLLAGANSPTKTATTHQFKPGLMAAISPAVAAKGVERQGLNSGIILKGHPSAIEPCNA